VSLKPKAPTIGYHYKWAMHFAWCRFADTLHKIDAGAKIVWTGCVHENQQIQISAPEAWGGEKAEGGVEGAMDVLFGGPTQLANDYLAGAFGEPQTGNRNVVTTVYRGGRYGAFVPNPKPMHMLWECIHAMWPGGEAWYPAKAAIPLMGGSSSGGNYLLITGGEKTPGGPMWCAAEATANPTFIGLDPSTGADIQPNGVPEYFSGTWAVADADRARYSLDDRATWQTSSISTGGDTVRNLVGNPSGWLAQIDAIYPIRAAGSPPSAYTSLSNEEYEAGNDWPSGLTSSYFAFRAYGYFFISYNRGLWRSTNPRGPFTQVCGTFNIEGNPNGSSLQNWWSISEGPGGHLYAVVDYKFNYADRQIRVSYDLGEHWYDADVILNVPYGQPHKPIELCYDGTNLIALAADGGVWTSANDWSGWVDNGINAVPTHVGSRHIASPGNGLTYAISYNWGTEPGDKCVVSANGGLVWSDPITMPIRAAYGIAAAGDPLAVEACPINAMNPAHIIYDALTGEEMQGEPTGLIDEASFMAAADQLFAEGFGLCTQYDSDTETPWDFIQRICNVIGGSLSQSRITGLYYLDLIRNNYAVETLPVITDDDIIEWQEEATVPAEMVNSVAVTWFDVLNKEERTTAPVVALGHVRTSGEVIPQTSVFKEIPFENIALRRAKMEVDSKSKPLRKFTLTVQRKHRFLRPSMPFRLQAPKRGIVDMVCRLGSISHGVHLDGRVRMIAVQDIFGLPDAVNISPITPPTESTDPTASATSVAIEAPYVELVASLTPEQLAAVGEETGYLLTGASAPTRGQKYAIYSALPSETLERRAFADFAPSATTTAAALPLDTTVALATQSLPERITEGDWAVWEDEIIRVDGISGGVLTMGRGCADTIPAAHAAGTTILFMGAWGGTDGREYAVGDVLAVKLPVNSGSAEQPLADVPELEVEFAQRQFRPYPPANLMLNGVPIYTSGGVIPTPPGGGGGGGGGGGVPTSPPATAANGAAASTVLGPNGGYADDAPPLFPLPDDGEIGDEMIEGGDFSDPADITGWRKQDGSPLGPEWEILDGRLHFRGGHGTHRAYYYEARRTIPYMPAPFYTFDTSADLQCDPNVQARFGVAWGTWQTGQLPFYLEASAADTFTESTNVTHSWTNETFIAGVGGIGDPGQYSVLNVMPVVEFVVTGVAANGWVDNTSLEISKVDPPMTAQTPANLDFSSGLTGYTLWPDPADTNPYVPDISVASGVLVADFISNYGPFRWIINDDPLPDADEAGKLVKIRGKVWCDDSTVIRGYPVSGGTFGIAYKPIGGGDYQVVPGGRVERGDFTERETVQRIAKATAEGYTVHHAVLVAAEPTFTVKVKEVEVYVSDAVVIP